METIFFINIAVLSNGQQNLFGITLLIQWNTLLCDLFDCCYWLALTDAKVISCICIRHKQNLQPKHNQVLLKFVDPLLKQQAFCLSLTWNCLCWQHIGYSLHTIRRIACLWNSSSFRVNERGWCVFAPQLSHCQSSESLPWSLVNGTVSFIRFVFNSHEATAVRGEESGMRIRVLKLPIFFRMMIFQFCQPMFVHLQVNISLRLFKAR